MKHSFKYYLHDNYEHSEMVEILSDEMPHLPREVVAQVSRYAFGEIELYCTFDDETFEVTILDGRVV